MKGKLRSGFKYEVDTEVFNDMEFIEVMAAAEGNEPLKIVEVVERLLGTDQKKALYDHLRNDAGRVPVEAVSEAIGEIIEQTAEDPAAKNS